MPGAANGNHGRTSASAAATKAAEKRLIEICASKTEDALVALGSRTGGLTEEEAEDRLGTWGENHLARTHRFNVFSDIFHRLKDPLVIELLIICAASCILKEYRSAAIVGGMLFLSVALGYIQERSSGRAVEKLQQFIRTTTLVRRDGKEAEIPVSQIVPGDIIILTAGDIIPADIRLLAAKDFFVSQSVLTGESLPIEKNPAAVDGRTDSMFSLANACFQGSNVISGRGEGVVVNTGALTYLGGISARLARPEDKTNFDRGVSGFVMMMVRLMLIMVGATFLLVGLTKHGWLDALLFALAVSVGLTPEMLPMIITVCLSKGALVMSGKKVIIKRLKAIQNFGAMDVLCTDKTGTLTQDRVILEKYVDVTNRTSSDVLRYAYMNSYYQTGLRSLIDKAVLNHEELDVERTCRKVDEIPFDFNRKRMSVIIDYEETNVLICKGAVEQVFGICDRYQIDDEIYPLLDILKSDLLEEYENLSRDGYRVLAIAYREFPRTKEVFGHDDESSLILLGYIAFFDPPKETASRALSDLRQAGVEVKILTGDNELVTGKICRDVGLPVTAVVTGRELQDLDDAGFEDKVVKNAAFAGLTPAQKERIIRVLRDKGRVVGFLGDGINDAPAMRAADVGISVDSAVDVAKEAADIVLLEKSLLVMKDGIVEGRKIFANITKYIKMAASSNFGNMFSVVGAGAILPFLPMTPVQVLTNNLLYDISQTSIPTDRVDEEYIARPRRWRIDQIRKFMTFIGPVSSLFDYATFFLMLFVFNCRRFSLDSTPTALKAHYEMLFHTGWFVESLLTQTLIVHVIRTNRIPFVQSRPSKSLLITTLAVAAIAVYLPFSPFAGALGLTPLPATYWLWIAGFLAAYALLTHRIKTWFYKKFGTD